ncbi:MAG: hypothetical protein GKS00_15200 [Alphaproteobacteria bacterium]|nr:hypothetical protein [Alphaproteobacteria bacterium]
MTSKPILIVLGILFGCIATAAASENQIALGEWRTESGKSLVCGGEEGETIVTIAKRANTFYVSGAKQGSAEYEAYWSSLEKALKERLCFITAKMRHIPDSVVYAGPEGLEAQGKRFKVIGTTIEEEGERYPAFTMTTLKVQQPK